MKSGNTKVSCYNSVSESEHFVSIRAFYFCKPIIMRSEFVFQYFLTGSSTNVINHLRHSLSLSLCYCKGGVIMWQSHLWAMNNQPLLNSVFIFLPLPLLPSFPTSSVFPNQMSASHSSSHTVQLEVTSFL